MHIDSCCVSMLQKFDSKPLGIRNLELWNRDPVALAVDFLQDPEYVTAIDWTGGRSSPEGVYKDVLSGEWFREVQVRHMFVHVCSCLFMLGYIYMFMFVHVCSCWVCSCLFMFVHVGLYIPHMKQQVSQVSHT